jgi:hypothetical protein
MEFKERLNKFEKELMKCFNQYENNKIILNRERNICNESTGIIANSSSSQSDICTADNILNGDRRVNCKEIIYLDNMV